MFSSELQDLQGSEGSIIGLGLCFWYRVELSIETQSRFYAGGLVLRKAVSSLEELPDPCPFSLIYLTLDTDLCMFSCSRPDAGASLDVKVYYPWHQPWAYHYSITAPQSPAMPSQGQRDSPPISQVRPSYLLGTFMSYRHEEPTAVAKLL